MYHKVKDFVMSLFLNERLQEIAQRNYCNLDDAAAHDELSKYARRDTVATLTLGNFLMPRVKHAPLLLSKSNSLDGVVDTGAPPQ